MCSGEPSSYVHGSIIDGVFAGRIDTPSEVFYIDKSDLYFREQPQSFHSVIYRDSDINMSPRLHCAHTATFVKYIRWNNSK